MKFTVILDTREEGGFTVTVPALQGCISESETREGVLDNIKEADEL